MKNSLVKIAAALLCVGLLCGCTKSTITNPEPDTEAEQAQENPYGIDWDKFWEDWTNKYTDPEIYPFAGTVSGGIFADENAARFFLLLNEDISPEEAQAYAMDVVKGFGTLIAEQNSQYSPASETSFGSFLDGHDIYVMVSNDDTKMDESTWILEDTIPAGQYREFQVPAAE